MKNLGKALLAIFFLVVIVLIIFNWPVKSKNDNMNFGISYSPVFARSIGLDWQKAYVDILEGLNVKKVRLASYWNEVEKEKGVYDFSETDWLLQESQKRNVKVILAFGIKVPRWPECFIPEIYANNKAEREEALLLYEQALIERYKNFDSIVMWQVENEPFLPFGDCLAEAIDGDLVSREVAQTKLLDPSRPVMVTDSGELSIWYQAAKRADIFGTTLYRTVYKPEIGYFNYPLGPNFFRTKAMFIRYFANQKNNIIISELQGEPWGPKWLNEMSLEEQYKSMSPRKLEDIAEYARKTNFFEAYFWGAEWWYWLKTQKGESAMWDTAKKIINNSQ